MDNHTNQYPELLNQRQASALTGLSRSRIYELLNRRDTGVVHIGARKYLHRDSFLAWLKDEAQRDAQ